MLIKTAKTSGYINKRVSCEKCGTRYLYELSRSRRAVSFVPLITLFGMILFLPVLAMLISPCLIFPVGGGGFFLIMRFRRGGGGGPLAMWLHASGEGGDEECDISANKKLRNALIKGAEPVPCPECGWYQLDMVREYRSRQLLWLPWIGLLPLVASQGIAYWLIKYREDGFIGIAQTGPDYKVITWLICLCVGGACMLLVFAARWLLVLRCSPNKGFPSNRELYPDAPPAVRESDYNAAIAAATAKLTPSRNQGIVEIRVLPPRALPPPLQQ
jgi:hypothetical protein